MSAHISALHSSSVYIAILFFISLSVHFLLLVRVKLRQFLCTLSSECDDLLGCNMSFGLSWAVVAPSRVATNWCCAPSRECTQNEQKTKEYKQRTISQLECKHGHYTSPLPRLSFEQCSDVPSYQIIAELGRAAFHVRCRRYRLIIVQRTNWPLIYSLFPCI